MDLLIKLQGVMLRATYVYRHGQFAKLNGDIIKKATYGLSPYDADFARGYAYGWCNITEMMTSYLEDVRPFDGIQVMRMKDTLQDLRRNKGMAKMITYVSTVFEVGNDYHTIYDTIGFICGALIAFKEEVLDD